MTQRPEPGSLWRCVYRINEHNIDMSTIGIVLGCSRYDGYINVAYVKRGKIMIHAWYIEIFDGTIWERCKD